MNNHSLHVLNSKSDIAGFCSDIGIAGRLIDIDRIEKILNAVDFPISILLEKIYNDKTYRDSYYHHFASKYSFYDKNARRLSIFSSDKIGFDDFFNEIGHEKLQELFIGTIVLKPIYPGTVGKTLVDPTKINLPSCCIRTTHYESVVLGAKLSVKSFPFSSQDSETMTCAETAIWSLMKYYGTRYPMYKVALPSDIHKATDANSFQRVLPSIGLAYQQSSGALKGFGFHPRYYASEDFYQPSDRLKRILYYYIASGIPTLCGVNLKKNGNADGHLVVCVGHSSELDHSKTIEHCCDDGKTKFFDIADSVNKFSFMDDNQVPFSIQSYDSFEYYVSGKYDSTNIKYLIAPLYKRIFLTAENASTYFYQIFKKDQIGLKVINDLTGMDDAYIIRIFLASSRKYKNFRSLEYSHRDVANIYMDLPLPKFIWIAEIGTSDTFSNGNIVGEVILDATASGNAVDESIISIHYPSLIAYRNPEQNFEDLIKSAKRFTPSKDEYRAFNQNLECI